MPRGAKTSTPGPVAAGKGNPKLLPTLKIVVDDEDGRFRGRKLSWGVKRERRQCVVLHRDASFKPPLPPSFSPPEETGQVSLERGKGKRFSNNAPLVDETFFFFFLL